MRLQLIDWSTLPLTFLAIAATGTLIGLWVGSDFTIKGAKGLAQCFGVSSLLIGLTIVSIVSSLPEIFINISAGLRGADDLILGNIIGSCFIQISFVLGFCTLIAGKLNVKSYEIRRDGMVLIAANVVVVTIVIAGYIGPMLGTVLILIYLCYLGYLVADTQSSDNGKTCYSQNFREPYSDNTRVLKFLLLIFVGCLLVWFMAEILVEIGTNAGRRLNLDSGIVGLWTGAGTSIPELSISTIAALRGAGLLSIGNLIGSNITDPFLSLGIGILSARGLELQSTIALQASLFWLAASIFAVSILWSQSKLTRFPAAILLLIYPMFQYVFVLNGGT